MKLTNYFDAFMKNTVNINDSRLRDLEARVKTLYEVLKDDDEIGDFVIAKMPQGSWAHKTIIKPIEGNEFDADFLVVMKEQEGWTPRDYLNNVYSALRRHGTYKEMTKKKDRCVRVVYANDCHIDIVPFINLSDGRQVIVNHETDEWEETDPEGFTAWLKQQDDIAGRRLRLAIRLVKYLRDHHMHFKRTRSVVLTILLGGRVDASKKVFDPAYYGDLPTAFVHLLEDLNDWLQANPTLPPLPDPSGAPNDFGHRWDQDSYDNLRNKVKQIAENSRKALDEPSNTKSHELWQAVFGSDFKKPPSSGSKSATVAGSAAVVTRTPPPTVHAGRDG